MFFKEEKIRDYKAVNSLNYFGKNFEIMCAYLCIEKV